jgi:RNA polymerase sigma factor (TIGR02999 family)
MSDVTRILNSLRGSEAGAGEELPTVLYEELRGMAVGRMRGEAPGGTLQPTALVHEAWLRLFDGESNAPFANRRHFFAAAAEAMRRILVESARRKKRIKRGGELERINIDDVEIASPIPDEELLVLDEAMDRFSAAHPRAAEVVKLCYFAGLTHDEAADILGVSARTVDRLWAFARAWLFNAIEKRRGS